MTMDADVGAERVAELEAIDDVQQRIDRVAEDLSSGQHRYAVIDGFKLGELLGLDFDDGESWSQTQYYYRTSLEDTCGFTFPLAENISLLADSVSKKRYRELANRAEAIIEQEEGDDISLQAGEEALLRKAYERENRSSEGPTLASTSVCSTSGVALCFDAVMTAGEIYGECWSPYDLAKGKGFDSSKYEED